MKNPTHRLLALLLVAAALLNVAAPLTAVAAGSDRCCAGEAPHRCCEPEQKTDYAPSVVCCDLQGQEPVLPPVPVVRHLSLPDVATAISMTPVGFALQQNPPCDSGDSPSVATAVFLIMERILI